MREGVIREEEVKRREIEERNVEREVRDGEMVRFRLGKESNIDMREIEKVIERSQWFMFSFCDRWLVLLGS